MTSFAQVSDNSYTRASSNTLNNTTSPITLDGVDTSRFNAITTGYIVTIWNDTAYPDNPASDPNMEKAVITAATINANGSITLSRPYAKAHLGTPIIAALVVAQHISDLDTAVTTLEATTTDIQATIDAISSDKHYEQPFTTTSFLTVTHNLHKYPAITIIDSAGDEVEADPHHVSSDQFTVEFSASFSGVVYCN